MDRRNRLANRGRRFVKKMPRIHHPRKREIRKRQLRRLADGRLGFAHRLGKFLEIRQANRQQRVGQGIVRINPQRTAQLVHRVGIAMLLVQDEGALIRRVRHGSRINNLSYILFGSRRRRRARCFSPATRCELDRSPQHYQQTQPCAQRDQAAAAPR